MNKSRFTEGQSVKILGEAAAGKKSQAELCREHGVSQNTFYVWKRKYSGLETQDVKRLRELEAENDALKRLLAERDLEVDAIRRLFRKNGRALPSGFRERGYRWTPASRPGGPAA
ncbi:MAG: transposase [Chthonomonadaceae bacterium]|nr:transposase [Chthonomonadaceae bacterium]